MRNFTKLLAFALSLCLVAVFLLPTVAAVQPGCSCVEITCPICEAIVEQYEGFEPPAHSVHAAHVACEAIQRNSAEIFVSGFIDSPARMNN